ncbi:hypothetical protein AB5N19_06066 [Seiridium cardinale]
MSSPPSPKATPKRKRDDLLGEQQLAGISAAKVLTNPVFTFEPPSSSQTSAEDGSSSPRTKVANKFRNLSLERSGGGVATSLDLDGSTTNEPHIANEESTPLPGSIIFGFSGGPNAIDGRNNVQLEDEDEVVLRKRHKHLGPEDGTAPGPSGESSAVAAGPVKIDEHGRLALDTAVDPSMVRISKSESLGGLKKSYPSINRLAESKSRSRRRSGTPPVGTSRRKPVETVEEAPVIVDPVRAALTWHEDEITVYDSEDKDDDGTGLNGIGFRPTPAVAHQRAQRRKKQLSEYKKREEREARAQRNQKRREALGGGSELGRHHSVIRVHFSDAEPETLVTS